MSCSIRRSAAHTIASRLDRLAAADGLSLKPDDGAARRGDRSGRISGRADGHDRRGVSWTCRPRCWRRRCGRIRNIFRPADPTAGWRRAFMFVANNLTPRRRQDHRRRQRAGAARAARRCPLLLGPGPQDARWNRASTALNGHRLHAKLGTVADKVARMRGAGRGYSPRTSARRRCRPSPAARRGSQGRSVDRHGRRIPGIAGRHGALLRAA